MGRLLEIASDIVKAQAGMSDMSTKDITDSLRKTFITLQSLQQMEEAPIVEEPAPIQAPAPAPVIQRRRKPEPKKAQPVKQKPVPWTEDEINLLRQSVNDPNVNTSALFERHTKPAVYSKKVEVKRKIEAEKKAAAKKTRAAKKQTPPEPVAQEPVVKKAARAIPVAAKADQKTDKPKVIRRKKTKVEGEAAVNA